VDSPRKISFIIPVFNGLELTKACLDSLTTSVEDHEHEIIVVDDGSTDGTRAFLSSIERPDVHVVLNDENLGYARANNAGAVRADGEFLCLANNDLVFSPGWLAPFLKAFDHYPDAGVVGNIQRTVATGAIDHAGIRIGLDGKPHHIRSLSPLRRLRTFSTVPAVTGACMMVRREDFLANGGFDERYVNGSEDVDFCFQMESQGKRVIVANRSVIEHHVSASRGSSEHDEENCRKLFLRWPDGLARFGARDWPAHYLRSAIARRVALDPANLLSALGQFIGLTRKPSDRALDYVRRRMAITQDHWHLILGGRVGRNIPSLFRDFRFEGLHPSRHEAATWIKERATITLPAGIPVNDVRIRGMVVPEPSGDPPAQGNLGLRLRINQEAFRSWRRLSDGPFTRELKAEPRGSESATVLEIELLGTAWTNTLAYLGRKCVTWPLPKALKAYLQNFRAQRRNQRLQIFRIGINGEDILDFTRPNSPFVYEFAQRNTRLGINLVGWFTGELGVGESVRCAAKALTAVDLPHALIPCRLPCLAAQGDLSFINKLQEDNPYPINIFHIDAPQSADIDHHHGPAFREGRYNIAYWAWELPEFPDGWVRYFEHFDEIWTPSRFTTEAVGRKSPLPVLTMPHAIDFTLPAPGARTRMNLPEDRFLFLMMYDLNSYQERKNPRAVIDAFARAFPNGNDKVGLVIKVHSLSGNETAFAELQEAVGSLNGVHLLSHTLPRSEVYDLIAACDCFVSLHRSEGFGLGVAEAMFQEKPVISTNWSATAEFVNPGNGCPVDFRLIQLERTIGPYGKGQIWADPDVGQAADWMRRVAADPLFCRETGYNARQTILKLFSPRVIGGLFEQRLRAITLW